LAGDKKVYEKAMREGHSFAWGGEWDKALAAYERAKAEMPEDPEVHNYLGLAYLELERFEPALEACSLASRLAPNEPAPLARIAEIHQRLGQRHAAADALFSMGRIYQRRRDWRQAIRAYQGAVQLHPEHLPPRMALATIYAQLDQPQRAVKEYLSLARMFRQQGQMDKAVDQCRAALELDPQNAEARALAQALQRGEPVEAIADAPLSVEGGASPADMARDRALEELAGIPFGDTPVGPETGPDIPEAAQAPVEVPGQPSLSRSEIDALVARAIDFQTRGLVDEAIIFYNKVIDAGVELTAAHFNLGLLYQQRFRFEPAIAELEKTVDNPQYSLGSHFALGECYKALGRVDDALEHFVQVLKIVDLGTVQRDEADDLIQLYDALAKSYFAKGDSARAVEFSNSLIEFLTSKGWEDKARAARQRLDSMSEEGVTMSLAEFLAAPGGEAILAAMSLSQEYVKRGAFTAATEVCYEAISAAPTYLPLHMRLADIFAQNERFEDSVAKYQAVADVYLVREETRQAIGVYRRILRLKPMDVVIRSRLIDLLISSGEIDQALEEYVALADVYYDLAQPQKALEKYTEALRLAPRASDEQLWRVRLLHNMAEMHTQRANWREAIRFHKQIVAIAPNDERARLNLIDLNYKMGRTQEADRETVAMLDHYREQGEEERALALMQEVVYLQPQQMPLRARMARAYVDAGMKEEAIRELDALGELQLDAGLRKQAMATVRFIISLGPKNLDSYRQLLAQL
jgi:tetratricopeptide (TPR) repeat protein